jgi:hypothetical protein
MSVFSRRECYLNLSTSQTRWWYSSHHFSRWEPHATSDNFKFIVQCGAESNTVIHSSNIQGLHSYINDWTAQIWWLMSYPVYCGRYIHITFENVRLFLSKSEWSLLSELASSCIDGQKLGKLHDHLIQWWNVFRITRNKCYWLWKVVQRANVQNVPLMSE